MLNIAKDTLPQSFLSYFAFRVSFMDTLERMVMARQFGQYPERSFGFLTEVPYLRNVSPQIQLELLLKTWTKHVSLRPQPATLVDESVVYAVCEHAANMVDEEKVLVRRYLQKGPMPVSISLDPNLAAELRQLHLSLSNEGDFLLISQFEDLAPEESLRLKTKFGVDVMGADEMLEPLGRWHVCNDIEKYCELLLNEQEIKRLQQALEPVPRVT
ncbi:hypothetical protein [Lacunimicrobium album]